MSPNVEKIHREQVGLFARLIPRVRKDFRQCVARAKDDEARRLLDTLEQRIIDVLEHIQSRVLRGKIHPGLPLRLSIQDAPVSWLRELTGHFQRVGFFATSGDPFYWEHIFVALSAMLELNLNTVVIQVMGDHPFKLARKQPKEHRHAIARLAIEYFFPLLRYTPLGYNNMKIGEENASELLLLNHGLPLEVCYIVGGDVHRIAVSNLAACRTLLKPRDGTKTPRLIGLLLPRGQERASAERLRKRYPFIKLAKRRLQPFPKVRGMELSSTMFRTDPEIPILPNRALDYIRKHGLYRRFGFHSDGV